MGEGTIVHHGVDYQTVIRVESPLKDGKEVVAYRCLAERDAVNGSQFGVAQFRVQEGDFKEWNCFYVSLLLEQINPSRVEVRKRRERPHGSP